MRNSPVSVSTLLTITFASLCCAPFATSHAAESPASPSTASAEYLGDHPELVLVASQGWGELGWNVAAHPSGQTGSPLQIGDKTYTKGIGHHAAGSIEVPLDGQYLSFDAEVGLQPCGAEGSVIFRVMVDDQVRFDSGVMRGSSPPKAVHVALAGAQELRLEADDAGDGISCDMADWVNARLMPAGASVRHQPRPSVDVARFGRVVTWDPNRTDGARANRVQEFHAEDLFLETNVPLQVDGTYRVAASANGLGCIGLQWLNRRALKELALEFPAGAPMPATSAVQVQGWFGESAWQGNWKPVEGTIEASANRLVFRLSPKAVVVQTQKVRWVFPATGPTSVLRLAAFTRSSWHTVKLIVEAEGPARVRQAELALCNGEFLPAASSQSKGAPTEAPNSQSSLPTTLRADLTRPLHLTLRASRTSSFKSDPTVLEFRLPKGSFGVAIEDMMNHDCVYLPDFGVFVTRDPAPVTLADYKRQIAGRKSILQQVRELPDQTLAQSMARTHHDVQHDGPVMLSLTCDNSKFVVDRDGTVQFQATTNFTDDWSATAGAIRPRFGSSYRAAVTRSLDGGWLPIPVFTAEDQSVRYTQRTFVAPSDEAGSNPARLCRRSLCVTEFTLTNTLAQPADASVALQFLSQRRLRKAATLTSCGGGYTVADEAGPLALATTENAKPLTASVKGGELRLNGTLPAHACVSFAILLPAQRTNSVSIADTAQLRADTEAYWKAVMAPAIQVETPDPLLNNVIRSSQVRCLIAARNEADGARVAPWIAAMAYGPLESESHSVIRGMDFMGHSDFARRGLEFFIHRYNTNGFLTTGYTTFGTPWHLWTLGEHYQLARDTDWLRQNAPEIERVTQWIFRQIDKTKQPAALANWGRAGHAPEYGLMPPGVLADWNSFAYHYCMNAYYYAALRDVGASLADLAAGDSSRGTKAPADDAALATSRLALRQATELRANLLQAYRWTQAQSPALPLRNGTWIPHYPSQVQSPGKLADFFPGQDAGRSWCYDVELGAHQLIPTGVFDPQDPEVTRMLDHMEDVQFLADGWFDYPASMNEKDWFNLGGFSKVQPYYTRNCEIYALRDDVKPFVRSYFNTLAAQLNPEVLTIWEHFHHSGAWDKTHETGYFLHQTRTMLVTERGNTLWLAPFVTSNWLSDGQTLSVSQAPTRFGPVSYRIESHVAQGTIRATIQPPVRQAPKQIVLRLRNPEGSPIRSVRLNGKRHSDFDATAGLVRLKPASQPLSLEISYR